MAVDRRTFLQVTTAWILTGGSAKAEQTVSDYPQWAAAYKAIEAFVKGNADVPIIAMGWGHDDERLAEFLYSQDLAKMIAKVFSEVCDESPPSQQNVIEKLKKLPAEIYSRMQREFPKDEWMFVGWVKSLAEASVDVHAVDDELPCEYPTSFPLLKNIIQPFSTLFVKGPASTSIPRRSAAKNHFRPSSMFTGLWRLAWNRNTRKYSST